MRIIHINDKLKISGGVEVSIRDISTELRTRGIETRWLALKREGKEAIIQSHDSELEWRGPLSELGRSTLAEIIGDDTVLHVHSLSEPAILQELFDLAPVVRHIHEPRVFCPGQGKYWAKSETICTQPFGLHCLSHAFTQKCCNRHPKRLKHQFNNTRYEVNKASMRYAMLIANSTYTKTEALKVGFPDDKICLLNYFTEVTPEPDWGAAKSPVITFAGRLSRTKGVHVLLDAFAQVLRDMPEARLEILGSGHDEQAFYKQADDLGLGDAVQFLGWADKDTIDTHLSNAAVVAFPSIYPEAFGITGIEAMMRGKPVVAFNVGGVPDWLHNGETGYTVSVKDVDAYANALKKILRDPDLQKTMGQKGRVRAKEAFSAESFMLAILEIYRTSLT